MEPFKQRSLTITDPLAISTLQATEHYFCLTVADMINLLSMTLKFYNYHLGSSISESVYHFYKVSE